VGAYIREAGADIVSARRRNRQHDDLAGELLVSLHNCMITHTLTVIKDVQHPHSIHPHSLSGPPDHIVFGLVCQGLVAHGTAETGQRD